MWRLVLEQFDDLLVKILLVTVFVSLVLTYINGPHEWWKFFGTSLCTHVVVHNKKGFVKSFKRLILFSVFRVVQFVVNLLLLMRSFGSKLTSSCIFFMALLFLSSTSLFFLWLYWFNSLSMKELKVQNFDYDLFIVW